MNQGSPEWFAARLGKATASRISDIVAKTKTGWGASRKNYLAELVTERLTGESHDGYVSKEMLRGSEVEPHARAAYEFFTNQAIQQMGFVEHPSIPMAGASPDGLVGEDGLVEIKCPNSATHIDTLLSGTVPGKYVTQMMWQMTCTGRKWCDFVSFDPRFPEDLRLFIKRVERDDAFIASLEDLVRGFLAEVDETIRRLRP